MSNSSRHSVLRRFVRAAIVSVGLVCTAAILIALSFHAWRWLLLQVTDDEAISLLGAVVLSPSTAAALMGVELHEFAADIQSWIGG